MGLELSNPNSLAAAPELEARADAKPKKSSITWARLLKRVFGIDISVCHIAIGRDNGPAILLNPKNKPYSNVTDLKVDDSGMTLSFSTSQPLLIGTEKMLEQINRPEAKLKVQLF